MIQTPNNDCPKVQFNEARGVYFVETFAIRGGDLCVDPVTSIGGSLHLGQAIFKALYDFQQAKEKI